MKDLVTSHKVSKKDNVHSKSDLLAKSSKPEGGAKDTSAIEHVKSLSDKWIAAQKLADTRLQEIIILSRLVFELRKQIGSVQMAASSSTSKPRRKSLWGISSWMKRGDSKLKGDLLALRKTPFFDQAWYLEQYPDVRISGLDPALHYLKFGAKEGRDPGPKFSTLEYLRTHAELRDSGENPLLHYIKRNG